MDTLPQVGLGANFGGINTNLLGSMGLSLPSTNPMGMRGQSLIPGSAAHASAFHAKGPDYEIKLFVGGLAF